ncbi:MAG: anthranilate phosphoribosyltransferase [Buchnera aphidicola (Pentalonia nigronervosa)]|jgi:anthranilate phosphoribosyltransferase|uniref:Anthranilate phosphoribosyltransferase n=1 Tax=Buchnera aphidicola (Pentalonia nigronervosa) TaxID=1309793 RepID=A0A7H1AZS0_9GAMM|nr:MAG: anthranilate phosphoribosyltransferase [Buchnera aphidicola (Pentalonia nigronervosa)]
MKKILEKIDKLQFLNQNESYQLFKFITSRELKRSFLESILIKMHKRGESIDEIIGAIHFFSENMQFFPSPNYIFSDIVGTGGDLKNTINVSTASSFVASACGFKIIKHCNQGISSTCGSADLLKKFNIDLNVSANASRQCLEKLNICFLFAPKYHHGFQNVNVVRKFLKIRTIFNILGPFLNPAKPSIILIGVYNKNFMIPAIEILKQLKYKRAIVVHGNNTDEVVLWGKTYVSELNNSNIVSYKLTPEDFGLKNYTNPIFFQSSPEQNYSIIKNVMQGQGSAFYEELIAVNVAMLLKLFGEHDLKKNTQLALNKIRSGDVYQHIINVSHALKEKKYE